MGYQAVSTAANKKSPAIVVSGNDFHGTFAFERVTSVEGRT